MTAPPTHPPAPTPLEAALVLGAAVGASVATDVWMGDVARTGAYTDTHLLVVVASEVALAALVALWLRGRGWTPRAVAGAPEPLDVVRGAVLWVLAFACYAMMWLAFAAVRPEAARAMAEAPDDLRSTAAPATVVLTAVVNPVFEEFLWLGYCVA